MAPASHDPNPEPQHEGRQQHRHDRCDDAECGKGKTQPDNLADGAESGKKKNRPKSHAGERCCIVPGVYVLPDFATIDGQRPKPVCDSGPTRAYAASDSPSSPGFGELRMNLQIPRFELRMKLQSSRMASVCGNCSIAKTASETPARIDTTRRVGVLKNSPIGRRHARPPKPYDVQACDGIGSQRSRHAERRHVHLCGRSSGHHGEHAHASELMDEAVSTDKRLVTNLSVAGEQGAVRQRHTLSEERVVTDVAAGHQQAVIPDFGECVFPGAAMHGVRHSRITHRFPMRTPAFAPP